MFEKKILFNLINKKKEKAIGRQKRSLKQKSVLQNDIEKHCVLVHGDTVVVYNRQNNPNQVSIKNVFIRLYPWKKNQKKNYEWWWLADSTPFMVEFFGTTKKLKKR